MVTELAHYVATDPDNGISSVHMYPLGGLSKTARWAYAASRGEFTLGPNQQGFKVIEE